MCAVQAQAKAAQALALTGAAKAQQEVEAKDPADLAEAPAREPVQHEPPAKARAEAGVSSEASQRDTSQACSRLATSLLRARFTQHRRHPHQRTRWCARAARTRSGRTAAFTLRAHAGHVLACDAWHPQESAETATIAAEATTEVRGTHLRMFACCMPHDESWFVHKPPRRSASRQAAEPLR